MKNQKLLATILVVMSIILLSFTDVNAGCVTECTYTDSGTGATCFVSFEQRFEGSGVWAFGVTCTDGYVDSDGGQGIYTGTICGGTDPVSPASCDA